MSVLRIDISYLCMYCSLRGTRFQAKHLTRPARPKWSKTASILAGSRLFFPSLFTHFLPPFFPLFMPQIYLSKTWSQVRQQVQHERRMRVVCRALSTLSEYLVTAAYAVSFVACLYVMLLLCAFII